MYKDLKKETDSFRKNAFGSIWIQPYYGLFSYYDPQDKVLKPARQTQGDQEADYHAPGLGYHIDKHRNLWLCCKSGFDQLTFSPRNYTLLRQERAGQYEIPNTIRGLFYRFAKKALVCIETRCYRIVRFLRPIHRESLPLRENRKQSADRIRNQRLHVF